MLCMCPIVSPIFPTPFAIERILPSKEPSLASEASHAASMRLLIVAGVPPYEAEATLAACRMLFAAWLWFRTNSPCCFLCMRSSFVDAVRASTPMVIVVASPDASSSERRRPNLVDFLIHEALGALRRTGTG